MNSFVVLSPMYNIFMFWTKSVLLSTAAYMPLATSSQQVHIVIRQESVVTVGPGVLQGDCLARYCAG